MENLRLTSLSLQLLAILFMGIITGQPTLNDYRTWKQKKEANFVKNKASKLNKMGQLLDTLYEYLEDSKKSRPKIALYAYNFLRELTQLPIASSLHELDREWLDSLDYDVWKQEKEEFFREWDMPLPIQLKDLIDQIYYELNKVAEQEDKNASVRLLYAYNYLRELLKLTPIKDISHIDESWLNEAKREIFTLSSGFAEATLADKELLKQAREKIGLNKDIIAVLHPHTVGGETEEAKYIAFCRTPDFDINLFVLYHELGHIANNWQGPQESLKDITYALNQPDMKADRAKLVYYVKKGKEVLDASTIIGRRILSLLAQQPLAWKKPQDNESYIRQVFKLDNERRADLFMLNTLYSQQHINPLLNFIEEAAKKGETIITKDSIHPASLERALYGIGFLADKNIDVNRLIREWEREGVCLAKEDIIPENLKAHQLLPMTSGAYDVKKALQPILESQEKEQYEKMKKKIDEQLMQDNKPISTESRLGLLFRDMKIYLKRNYEEPSLLNESNAMHMYNYARELLNQPLVSDIKHIDLNWVAREQHKLKL
jgi:hypothetical protein